MPSNVSDKTDCAESFPFTTANCFSSLNQSQSPISISNLNPISLFATERGKRELDRLIIDWGPREKNSLQMH